MNYADVFSSAGVTGLVFFQTINIRLHFVLYDFDMLHDVRIVIADVSEIGYECCSCKSRFRGKSTL